MYLKRTMARLEPIKGNPNQEEITMNSNFFGTKGVFIMYKQNAKLVIILLEEL